MAVGMSALSIAFPKTLVRNDYWREHHPQMVENAENHAAGRLWSPGEDAPEFDRAMEPFLSDPFRGVKDRRWLAADQPVLEIEIEAAQAALEAAKLEIGAIDLLICSSFFPDQPATGNAAFLARALDLDGPAWNLESACSSSTTALSTACALIDAGQHHRVLCVTSCSYSKAADTTNPVSWVSGDGATAFIVEDVAHAAGLIASSAQHTGDTCGAIAGELIVDASGKPKMSMVIDRSANRLLRTSAAPMLSQCVTSVLDRAGLTIDAIAAFIVNTPTAWHAAFSADVLGVPVERVANVHPLYANTGPVLTPSNLWHAAHEGLIKAGDKIVLFSLGSVSSARAIVLEWNDVALGPLPPPSSSLVELQPGLTSAGARP